jgi:hypothetical protein
MTSGFAIGIAFLFWAAIMLYSPRYLRVSANPYATLALYAVGTLALMIALAGIGFELSSPKLGRYFTVFVSEGPSSIPWAGPSGEVWVNAGIGGAFLVGMGFFHVAAELLGRWRILEVLLKMLALLFAGLTAVGLAGVVDELILKPLFLLPADRLASGQTVPADPSSPPQGDEPSDGSGSLLGNTFNAVAVVGTLISTISALTAGWGFVLIRTRNILKLLKR